MNAIIVFLKADKSIIARGAGEVNSIADFLSINGYDDTHDATVFEPEALYKVSDYDIDAEGLPVLSATAGTNSAARIKAAFSTDAEFKILKLAFGAIISRAQAGTLDTYSLKQLADDIESGW